MPGFEPGWVKTTYPNQLDYTEFYDAKILRAAKKKVLPGLEPGLQGSKPWVLTNYTIEPNLQVYNAHKTRYKLKKF